MDKGIHYVRLALDIEPENIEFLTFAGSVLISKGDVNNGAPLLEKAIKLDPKNWLAHGNLGISYYVRKQFDLAIESYKKSLQAKFSLFFLLRLVEPYILKHRSLLYAFSISFFIAYIIGHKLRF